MFQQVLTAMYKDYVTQDSLEALEGGQWHEALWKQLIAQQLHEVGLNEAGDFLDVCTLHRLSGYYAAPIPFIEHTLACNILSYVDARIEKGMYTVTQSNVVPWGCVANYVVVIEQDALHLYDTATAQKIAQTNMAAEPRDIFTWTDAPLQTFTLTHAQYTDIRAMMTMSNIFKITGAIERAAALTIQFSKEREQFGRPIHRFQLVQRHIATIAGEEAVLQAACNVLNVKQPFQVGAALIRAEEAIEVVTASAHQVHAAIGVTHEHTLHYATRRLWAWREEGYRAREWKQLLAEKVHTYKGTLWAQLTEQ